MDQNNNSWKSAKLSAEAHKALRLVAAITDRDIREIVSTAVLSYCAPYIQREGHFKERRGVPRTKK